jgi:hypothetical protein
MHRRWDVKTHWRKVAVPGLAVAILTVGVAGAGAYSGSSGVGGGHESRLKGVTAGVADWIDELRGEDAVPPGTIDDGKHLLPLATISLDRAIEIAQGAETGDLGEVDLEQFEGHLVFNIDIGDHDVKVDAADGSVLSSSTD